MDQEIPGTLLLSPVVLGDPYPFYKRLREHAPVWEIAGTGVFTVTTFELLVEASGRVGDFSSAMKCLIYRDEAGLPGRFEFGERTVRFSPPLTRPCTRSIAGRSFLNS